MSTPLLSSQFRVLLIYSSTALSLTLMMLMLNIITIPEIIKILRLNPHGTEARTITNILVRMQEVTNNIIDIIAKLFSKVLNSFGMADIDISKIKVKPGTHGIPSVEDGIISQPPVENINTGQPPAENINTGQPPAENTGIENHPQCDSNGVCIY
jgi:hypothetical protein